MQYLRNKIQLLFRYCDMTLFFVKFLVFPLEKPKSKVLCAVRFSCDFILVFEWCSNCSFSVILYFQWIFYLNCKLEDQRETVEINFTLKESHLNKFLKSPPKASFESEAFPLKSLQKCTWLSKQLCYLNLIFFSTKICGFCTFFSTIVFIFNLSIWLQLVCKQKIHEQNSWQKKLELTYF